MHAVLIENPIAHNVTPASLRVAERALEATFDLELVSTQRRGHAADLAREAVEAGAKTVIAYGGDGTVNEVVNGLLGAETGTDVVFGVLPGGGTNVLARNLGYPNDLVEATAHLIELVENGSPRRIGLGRIHAATGTGPLDRVFTFGAGLVLDAETVRRVEASGLRPKLGDMAYVWCAIRSFFSLRRTGGPALVVDTPEGPVDAWWAMVGLSGPFTYLGKRALRVLPRADHDRGLDLVAGTSMRIVRTLRWVSQALRAGRHVEHRDITHLEDRPELTVEALRPVALQADGEDLGDVHGFRAVSLPRALPVWA